MVRKSSTGNASTTAASSGTLRRKCFRWLPACPCAWADLGDGASFNVPPQRFSLQSSPTWQLTHEAAVAGFCHPAVLRHQPSGTRFCSLPRVSGSKSPERGNARAGHLSSAWEQTRQRKPVMRFGWGHCHGNGTCHLRALRGRGLDLEFLERTMCGPSPSGYFRRVAEGRCVSGSNSHRDRVASYPTPAREMLPACPAPWWFPSAELCSLVRWTPPGATLVFCEHGEGFRLDWKIEQVLLELGISAVYWLDLHADYVSAPTGTESRAPSARL